jgi:hypothetical protein
MAIHYNYKLGKFPYFSFDAQSVSTYKSDTVIRDRIGGGEMDATGVTIASETQGKSYTFANSTNSFSSADEIMYTVPESKYSNYFLDLNGCASFVTFNNTSLLSESAPGHFRQTPFSFGTDSGLGCWNFERFKTNSNYGLRVKFDQDGTYGFTKSFGDVALNEIVQLGFQIRDNNLLLYNNGTLVSTTSVSSKTLTPANFSAYPGRKLGIGASGGTIYGFIGKIFNATWWKTSLTDEEIKLFYNQTVSRYS